MNSLRLYESSSGCVEVSCGVDTCYVVLSIQGLHFFLDSVKVLPVVHEDAETLGHQVELVFFESESHCHSHKQGPPE